MGLPGEPLEPSNAVLIRRFGDLGLVEGQWEVLGSDPGWDRDRWPVPGFGRREELTGRSWRVEYSDADGIELLGEMIVSDAERERLPEDGLAGAGFVEQRLTRLLG